VRPCMQLAGAATGMCVWLGSDFDGAFAQFVTVPVSEVFVISCDLPDYELGAIPCAFGTAENMLLRAQLTRAENVLVIGASGGVGSATVQLARQRGAFVTAIAERSKMAALELLGADRVIDRDTDIAAALGPVRMDVVVDNVAGSSFGERLKLLKRGGRYVSSGAIAGPLVSIDMRTLYLRDLSILGCTAWEDAVFANLVAYIERCELRPRVAQVFPLEEIERAQKEFLNRAHIGKFVLIPPPLT
jgi:NADPH:quinone reductase-like Zn-dependent oxidoreductase